MSEYKNDYVYGVGFKLNQDSLKQAKNDLKLNLDSLSKLVKSYGKVLKIDPNADLSKLFDEVRKIKGIVDVVDGSDVSFGNFVDKGTLARIATLENRLQAVSETSEVVASSVADLKTSVSEVTEVLKQAGAIKFPATFENLFDDIQDQTAHIEQAKDLIKKYKSDVKNLRRLFDEVGLAYNGKSVVGKGASKDQIRDWLSDFEALKDELAEAKKLNADVNQISKLTQQVTDAGIKLISALQDMSPNQLKQFAVNDTYISGIKDYITDISLTFDTLIAEIETKQQQLGGKLQELKVKQSKYIAAKSKKGKDAIVAYSGQSHGVIDTAQVKVTPKTNEVEWANKINDTIKNIEPQLLPIKLTPTFTHSSKNIQKEMDDESTKITHAVNVDINVKDNLVDFENKIRKIDTSIKNAKQQLEKNGNFTIKFDYEEGGKFRDTAYKIIDKFKKIDVHLYITNGKKFLNDIKGIKDSATTKLKDIPATLVIDSQEKLLESVDTLRTDIDKKIGRIGVKLHIQNMPEFVSDISEVGDHIASKNITNVDVSAQQNTQAKETRQLSDAAKKAIAELEKLKSILHALKDGRFDSTEFLDLGDIDKNGKKIKGSTEKLIKLRDEYKALQQKLSDKPSKDDWMQVYPEAHGNVAALQRLIAKDQDRLAEVEAELDLYYQKQIAHIQDRQAALNKVVQTEGQVAQQQQEQVEQAKKTSTSNAQKQVAQETKDNKQLAMSADAAAKKVRSLNGILVHQKNVLKDLEANGINAASFTKLGEWDKDSKSFKKNSQEIQELLKKYKELQKARLATGNTKVIGEEASLRGKLAAILKEQKKHVTEIISANQSELASVKAIASAQKQARASQSGTKQVANTKAAAAEQDKLNKKIQQQQQILNDLNKKGWQSKYFAQLGTWDKETQKFKKNAAEMQILIKQYMDLKKAREDAGIKSPVAGSEELKLRGRISALLKEQKKHIKEIIAKNQEELESAKKIAAAYKQADASKADSDKKPVASAKGVEKTTDAVDQLNASLEKAKQALQLLQSGKIDIVKFTGLGDIGKRIDASGIKQSLNWIVNRYKILLTKKQEFEKAGATGSDEYVRNEKQIQIYEQLLTNIYQDQLKYTQSRIGQLEAEITKRKEILALQEQQGKAEAAQQTKPKEQKQQQTKGTVVGEKKSTGQIPKDASSVVKLDGATLKSLAKDSTLKSIDGKLGSILQAMGHKPNQRGNKLNIEAKDAVINSGASAVVGNRQQQSSATSLVVQTMSAGMLDRINRANALSKAGIKISRGTLLRDGNDAFDQILQGVSPRDVVQNIIWPKLVDQLKAKGLTDSDQFNDILSQIAKQSSWKSKTSSSWIHFATPDAKFNDKITKKAYASFANVGDMSSELINQILAELRSRGYKGQIKIPSDITGFYDTDQIVGHAVDDNSFMILVDVLKQFEKLGTLLNVQTGVDANTKVSFGAKGKQGASFTTMLEEIYKAAPGQVFSVDEIKSIIKAAVASTSGDVDQALFKPIVEDVIRKRGDQAGADQIAASADRATREQSELNAELAETAQKDGATQGTINDNLAQDAEHATQEQRELNDELERTQQLSSSVVVRNNMTGDVSKIVDTYRSDDKVNETQEIYGKVSHGKDNPPTFEHTATVTKTNMEAYNRLYNDYIKSLSKQLAIEQKIASTNGPTSKLQEDLKVQKEITAQLESQLQQHADLFTEQSKQSAMAEATKKANQATATSNAKASDAAINKQIATLNKAVDSAQQTYKDMSASVNNLSASTASPIKKKFVEYEQLLKKLQVAQQDIAKDPQLLNDESYIEGLKQLLSHIKKAEGEFNTLNQSATEFKQNLRSASDFKIMDNKFDVNNLSAMHDEMRNFANAAGYGEAKLLGFNDVNRTATFEIKNGQGQIQQLTVAYNAATNALGRYVSKTTEGTSKYQKFFAGIKKSFGNVVRYLASFGSVYQLFAAIRQGITYVREIDSALTELKKVTDETDASYDRFLQNMSKTASTVGGTVSELTTMAAEWARLGYSMEEAGMLAESTAILLNVSEFSDATAASEALISTMQAFGYAADESQHVVDILNEVGNNYAVSSDGLATALQDSASSLMEAGNTLEQSVALIAAANRVVQDPNSVGSALRTISLRLRGTSVKVLEELGEETDGAVESVSKLQEKVQALSGVNILDASGSYKDTYTILEEIGEVWENMSDIDQAALLELLAGKNRANTLAAILGNMDDLKGAYDSAIGAEGSALRENAAYLDSIQGRIDLFNNAVQTMWANFIDDDFVKWIVDLGTVIVGLVDKIGLIPTALGAFAGFNVVKKTIKQDLADIGTIIRESVGLSDKDVTKDVAEDISKDAVESAAKDASKSASEEAASAIATVTQARDADAQVAAEAVEVQEEVTDAMEGQIEVAEEAVEVKAADTEADLIGAAAEQTETKAIEGNTTATEANTGAGVKNVATDVTDNAADTAGAASENAETAAIHANTSATVLNTVAQKAAHAAKALAIGLVGGLATAGIAAAIGFVIGGINELIHAEEKAIERANDALNKYKEDQQKLKDQKGTIEDLAEAYTRLAPGVNTFDNTNIGLTTESYQEYLEVCNDIADMFPDLVSGYDAQGNAIIDLRGEVDNLTKSYIRAQEEAANTLLTTQNKKDIWTTYKSNDMTEYGFVQYYDNDGNAHNETVGMRTYKEMIDAILAMPDALFEQVYDTHLAGGYLDGKNLYDDILWPYFKSLGMYENESEMSGIYLGVLGESTDIRDFDDVNAFRSHLTQQVATMNQQISANMTGIIDAVLASLLFNPIYQDLGEDGRAVVQSVINNMDPQMVEESGAENLDEFITWVSDYIITNAAANETLYADLADASTKMSQAMFNGDADAFEAAHDEFSNLIPEDWLYNGSIVINDDDDYITKYIKQLVIDAQNEAKNFEVRLEIRADLNIENSRPINEVVAEYEGEAQDEIQNAIDNLELGDGATLGDIFGTIGVHLDTNEDEKLRADEINDAYNDYLSYLSGDEEAFEGWTEPQIEAMAALHALCQMYGTDIATIIDEMIQAGYAYQSLDGINSFNLASESTNEFVDKFQEDIDAINDAWESLNSGEMTQSDFLDLAQEFPELMDGVDFSDDNWMTKAKDNLEALNKTTVDDFIADLIDMRDAMASRGEDTAIIDSIIAYAEKQRDLAQVVTEVQANTVAGLTEVHEKYKSIMEETNEILYNGQKVSDGYYESLAEYIDDTEALNACFDENSKQIVTNVDALKELIDQQHEADVQNVRLAKSQAQLRYYELVRQMGDATRAMGYFDAAMDATTDAILEQIRTVKDAIVQYQLLEDNLLGTTSAFEKFAAAKELDDQNTYGASYAEMAQVMYDALYETGQVGSAQFWAAVEATVPDSIYKHLMPGTEQIRAIYDYFNKNIIPTLTFDESTFSIDYSDIEAFIERAQEVGVFSGTDVTSFGLSSDFIYGLEEGENALEAFANRMGMTASQVYAILSEMDKYTTDGAGLSMLMRLDTSTSGQITYITSELEKLYAQRKALLEQGASSDALSSNMAQIYEAESQLAGLQKQATDVVNDYIVVQNALVDTSKTVREALPYEIWKTELQLTGDETVQEVLQQINDYALTLQEPTVMELQIARDSIDDELRGLIERFSEEKLEANVALNEDGLYEIKDGKLTIDTATLDRYVELKNAQMFIDDALMDSMSVQEQLLTNIDKNVADIAGEEPVTNGTEDGTTHNSSTNETNTTSTSEKPAPNKAAVMLMLDTDSAIYHFAQDVSRELAEEEAEVGIGGSVKALELASIGNQALQLQKDLNDGKIFAEDAIAQLSELQTQAAYWDVPVTLTINSQELEASVEDAADDLTIAPDVDFGNRPSVPFNLEYFGEWENYYEDAAINPAYSDDFRARANEILSALDFGNRNESLLPQIYYKGDLVGLADGESDAAIVLTPILPDGTVLSPEQLAAYATQLFNGEQIEPNITLGFFDEENCATEAERFVANLNNGLNEISQQATTEVDALYGVYASYEEALATLEAIADKNIALTSEEALAFGWVLAEDEILTVADAIQRLKQEHDSLRMTSVYNPEQAQDAITTVQTLSELQTEMSDYNEALAQTQEIIYDNVEVSQDYKDTLIELGITEEELNECFDESNPLLVANAKSLNKLVKDARNNVATNIKLAKSQAQLKYYELYKEMAKLTSGTGKMTDATYDNVQSLYSQMGAVHKSIAQFSMLEAQLLGATNAYDKLSEAQEIDSANDYGSKAEELVNILGNAFNTAELGTQAAQTAIAGLIPDDVIDKTKTLDEQMQQIYEYFTKGKVSKLFTIEFDDDGNISSVDMTKENVEAFTKALIEDGEVFHGTWDEFTLDPSIKTLDDFAEALGVTKEVAFAYLTELEKYDINWLGGDHETLLDQLMGDNFEYQIQKTIQKMAQLQQEKAVLMKDGITDDEAARIAEINAELGQLDKTMAEHQETAYNTWQEYSGYENVLTALDQIKDKATTLTEAQALDFGLTWVEGKTVQEYYDEILAKQALLEEPTELVLQLASEQVTSELDALKASLEKNTGVDIEANVHFNTDTGDFEYAGDTTGWSDEDVKNLQAYLDLSGDLYAINNSIGLGIEAMEGYAKRTADAVENIDKKITGDVPAQSKQAGGADQTPTNAETATVDAGSVVVESGNVTDSAGDADTGDVVTPNATVVAENAAVEADTLVTQLAETETALAAKTAEVEAQAIDLAAVRAELASTQEALSDTTEILSNVEADLADAKSSLASVEADFASTAAQLEEAENALAAATADADSKAAELANAQATIAQNEQLLANAGTALAETNATLVETDNLLTDAKSALVQTQADLAAAEATIKSTQSQLDTANAKVATLTDEKVTLESTLAEHESQLSILNERLATAEADKATLAASVADLTSQLTDVETRLSQAESDIDSKDIQIGSLNQIIGGLQQSLDEIRPQLEEAQQNLATANADISAIEAEKANLEAQVAETAAKLQDVNASLEVAESALATIQAEKAAADEMIALLNINKGVLETTISQMGSQIDGLNNELIAAQDSKAAAEQALAEVKEINAALEADVASLTQEKADLEADVADLTAQLNAEKSEDSNSGEIVFEDQLDLDSVYTNNQHWVVDPEVAENAGLPTEVEAELQLDTEDAEGKMISLLNTWQERAEREMTSMGLQQSFAQWISQNTNVLLDAGKQIDEIEDALQNLGVKYGRNSWFPGHPNTYLDGEEAIVISVPSLAEVLMSKGWTREEITSYFNQLFNIKFTGFKVVFEGAEQLYEVISTLDIASVEDKEFDVTAEGSDDALRGMQNINDYQLEDKSVEITTTYTTKYKTVGSTIHEAISGNLHGGGGGSFESDVNGTAHACGTWGAAKTETALTGELGPELRVRGNRWELLGENGAEFNEVRKGDIIFNHKQTEELLTNGYITGRGKAFAEGTVGGAAYALARESGAIGSATPIAYDVEAKNVTITTQSTGVNTNTYDDHQGQLNDDYGNQGSTSSSGGSGGDSDDKDEFNEVFDWIEVRLEEINEDINLNAAKLENAIGSTKQNAIIDNMIGLNKDLYDTLIASANEYYDYAATLLKDIPAEYRAAAKDGKIAIEEFVGEVDEETLNAIQKYREWVQKGADVTQQAEEVLTEISNLAKQAIDNIAQDYENKSSFSDSKIEQLEAFNSLTETDLGYESASIYQAMINENNRRIGVLQEQRNAMLAELNKRVESGEIKRGSQAWYDAINEIAAVDTEIVNLKTDTENWQDAINDLHWDKFDSLISRLQSVSEEAENLIDILGNSDLADEAGNWTDEGIASLGLYAQQMEAAEVEAKKYQDEIDYLNENWQELGYTEDEYLERLGELKDGQYAAIKSYHDSKDAIVDMTKARVDAIKKGIEEEIEAYEELISKKKEELDAEKDLYDFQKGIASQQKNIAEIQRKLAALSGDNSASARAKRAQLEAELAEAQQELSDTYYDRSVSNQQDALDQELDAFREEKDKEMEGWDEYLTNTNQVVSDCLATVQENTETVYQVLQGLGEEYGLSITESLTAPWQEGENAIQSFAEKFGVSMSATVEELQKLEVDFIETMANIELAGKNAAETVRDNFKEYKEAEKTTEQSGGGDDNSGNGGGGGDGSSTAGMVSGLSGNIQYGHTGDNVKKLQQALNALGFNCGDVDGIFGSKTYAAVQSFQQSSKYGGAISVDGIVGPDTKKKFKTAGYASGTLGVKSNQIATLDELGEELVIRPSKGRMTFMEKGTSVIPADLTANLMGWGELDPSIMLERNRPVISAPHVTNNNVEINMEFGEVVHIDTVTNDTIPNLTKAIEKQMDKYMKNVNNNIRKYAR